MREMNTEMELNLKELEQVSGGGSFCIGWGMSFGSIEATACAVPGATRIAGPDGEYEDDTYGVGAIACALIFGVGAGATWQWQ